MDFTMFKCLLISISAVFFWGSCQNQLDEQQHNPLTKAQDSISIWLETLENEEMSGASQTALLEKLDHHIYNISNDSVRLEQLSSYSIVTLEIGDTSRFKKTNTDVIRLSQELGDSLYTAGAYWDLGTHYNSLFIRDSAYQAFVKAQKLYSSLNNEFESSLMYYNMAVMQKDIKDFTGSEINTVKAIEGFAELNDSKHLFRCYNLLGSVTKSLQQFEQSQEYFAQAQEYLDNIEATPDKQELQNSLYNNIGNSYKAEGAYAKGIPYFKKALSTEGLLEKHPEDYALYLDNLTYSRFKSGENQNISEMFYKALDIQDSLNNLEDASITNYHLAEYFLNRTDTTKATEHAIKSLEQSRASSTYNQTLATLKIMAVIEPQNASDYLKKYVLLNDSLNEQERKVRNKFTRIQFETDTFIKENEVLTKQKRLWVGIAVGLFLLAFAIYIIIHQRAKNEKLLFLKQQQETNQEVFNLMLSQNQKIEEGKKNIQRRISEELHDGVLGQLNGIRMILLGLNKKSDDKAINIREDAIVKLQDVQEELRTISHQLNHSSRQQFNNFMTSLEALFTENCKPNDISHDLQYTQEVDWDSLSGDIKVNLYRIFQELLYNTIRHAHAKKIVVTMDSREDQLEISYKDDGMGYDSHKNKKGIGHKNISSRISRLNGTWQITSAPDIGTSVSLEIPIHWATQRS